MSKDEQLTNLNSLERRSEGHTINYICSFAIYGYLLSCVTAACRLILISKHLYLICSLEDFDGEEVDEEALIEQRRQQRLAIVQVCARH